MTREQKSLRETFQHITRLVDELKSRPDVQFYCRERGISLAKAPDGFLRALIPGMLTDSELWTLASECKSPMVFLVARSILMEKAAMPVYHHDPLADVRRTMPVLRTKVYA